MKWGNTKHTSKIKHKINKNKKHNNTRANIENIQISKDRQRITQNKQNPKSKSKNNKHGMCIINQARATNGQNERQKATKQKKHNKINKQNKQTIN